MLQNERTFPYDILDEIFHWSCEGSRARALQLGLVCRFWQDRFQLCDRMWSSIQSELRRRQEKEGEDEESEVKRTLGTSRRVPRLATSWGTYNSLRWAFAQSAATSPIPPPTLHPIEDCSLEFTCPMFSERLRYVGPGVSYCDVCRLNVYTVRSQEEMEEATQKGRCVQFQEGDVSPSAETGTGTVRIAVLNTTPSVAVGEYAMRSLAALTTKLQRSQHVLPKLIFHSSVGNYRHDRDLEYELIWSGDPVTDPSHPKGSVKQASTSGRGNVKKADPPAPGDAFGQFTAAVILRQEGKDHDYQLPKWAQQLQSVDAVQTITIGTEKMVGPETPKLPPGASAHRPQSDEEVIRDSMVAVLATHERVYCKKPIEFRLRGMKPTRR